MLKTSQFWKITFGKTEHKTCSIKNDSVLEVTTSKFKCCRVDRAQTWSLQSFQCKYNFLKYDVRTIEYCFINIDSSKHHQVFIKFKKNDSQMQLISNLNKIQTQSSVNPSVLLYEE